MRIPATVKWIGLALLGLAIAAAVAIAAGNLAGQQIGISNESLTAGDQLAPAVAKPGGGGKEQPSKGGTDTTATTTTGTTGTESTAPTTTETTPPVEPTTPSEPRDDSGGSGGGSDD